MRHLAIISTIICFGGVYETAVNGSDTALIAIAAGIGLLACAIAVVAQQLNS